LNRTQVISSVCGWKNEKQKLIEKAFLTFFLGVPIYAVTFPLFLLMNTVRSSGPIFFGCGFAHALFYYLSPSFYYNVMWWTGIVSPIGAIAFIRNIDDDNKRR
jgi:hypothetical protein